jgi:hypothetical protein
MYDDGAKRVECTGETIEIKKGGTIDINRLNRDLVVTINPDPNHPKLGVCKFN